MSENPDNEWYLGFGPQSKQLDGDGNEMNLDARYLVPTQHQLRFVERGVPTANPEVLEKRRILQQYQWSAKDGKFDWYDVPLVTE
jgi:hypothetical protein